jgi:rare lipoprotein A
VEVESIHPGDARQSSVDLQVGAFASRENAEDYRSQLSRQLAWLTDEVQVLTAGGLWRLLVGPYDSNDAARSVATRIEGELNLKPLVVVR